MEFVSLCREDKENISRMSALASAIVREHFDPLIGEEQNTYMIQMFQRPQAIERQLSGGYRYYFVREDGSDIGFTAFYPKENCMYLSKFYLKKEERGKGYAKQMLAFVKEQTKEAGLDAIELNVNRDNSAVQVYEHLGFSRIRCEKSDIGNGFYMDDFLHRLEF